MIRNKLRRHRNLLTGFFVASALISFAVLLVTLAHKKGVFELRYTVSAVFENGWGVQGTSFV